MTVFGVPLGQISALEEAWSVFESGPLPISTPQNPYARERTLVRWGRAQGLI